MVPTKVSSIRVHRTAHATLDVRHGTMPKDDRDIVERRRQRDEPVFRGILSVRGATQIR